MNILILGSGYIGSTLADYLSNDSNNLIEIITRNISLQYSSNVIINNSDFLNEIDYKNKIQNSDIIINTIGTTAEYSKKYELESFKINLNAILLINKYALEKTNVIYLSTVWVYGDILDGFIDENNSTLGKSNYALARIQAENILLNSSKIIPFILRLSIVYGWPKNHNSNCWNLSINNFVKSAVENNYIKINTIGTQLRDNISILTVCKSIKYLLDNIFLTSPGIYNLSSSSSISIIDQAELIRNRVIFLLGRRNLKIVIGKIKIENNKNLVISHKKFSNLGFKFSNDMSTTIDDMINKLNIKK